MKTTLVNYPARTKKSLHTVEADLKALLLLTRPGGAAIRCFERRRSPRGNQILLYPAIGRRSGLALLVSAGQGCEWRADAGYVYGFGQSVRDGAAEADPKDEEVDEDQRDHAADKDDSDFRRSS